MTQSRSGRVVASVQCSVAVLAGLLAWILAPDVDSAAQHGAFVDFFATSAQVIAALMVALAIESRLAVRHRVLAIVTALCLSLGEISAVAALSPSLPDASYRWLFVFTVGGGSGAMVAAVIIGAQTLVAEANASALRELWLVAERAERDKQSD